MAARITTDTLVCWRSKYTPGPSEAPVRLFFAKQIPSRVRKEMHRLTARLKDGDTVFKETRNDVGARAVLAREKCVTCVGSLTIRRTHAAEEQRG